MPANTGCKNMLVPAALLAILPLVHGCGGGDGEEDETATPLIDNTSGRFVCYSWTAYYEDPATCGGALTSTGSGNATPPPTGPGDDTTPPPPGSGIAALVNDELEPNNSRANANVMGYPTRSGSITHIGWSANGSISDTDDAVDYFSFTAPMSRDYTLRLCPPSGSACHGTTGLDTLTAFFELLDQDGTVLLSSQAAAGNSYAMPIDAGVAYYVRILAGDTMGAAVNYSFQAFENK